MLQTNKPSRRECAIWGTLVLLLWLASYFVVYKAGHSNGYGEAVHRFINLHRLRNKVQDPD